MVDLDVAGLAQIDLANPARALPKNIGPFTIRGRLGAGGMGVVLDALTASGRRVALKLIRPSGDPELSMMLTARLLREARILQQLDHPGVVGICDSGRIGEVVYLAMDYVEGVTLNDIRRRGPIADVGVVVAIAKALAEALDVLHEAGIIHRDIKPGNVLIDSTGRPILTDFGIAREETSTAITKIGELLGSPGFVAPEIIAGHEATPKSDQFALGKLLFEICAIRPLEKLADGVPPIVQFTLRMEVDWSRFPTAPPWPGFASIVRRLLAKDPRERFASCKQLIEAIVAFESVARPRTRGGELDSGLGRMVAETERNRDDSHLANPTVFAVANTLHDFLQALDLEPRSPWREQEPTDAETPVLAPSALANAPVHLGPQQAPPGLAGSPHVSGSQYFFVQSSPPAHRGPPPPPPASLISAPPVRSVSITQAPSPARGGRAPRGAFRVFSALVLGLVLGGGGSIIALNLSSAPALIYREHARREGPTRESVARVMMDGATEQLGTNDVRAAEKLLADCVDVTGSDECGGRLSALLLIVGDPGGEARFDHYVQTSTAGSELLRKLVRPDEN